MIDDKQKNDSLFSCFNDWSSRKVERVEAEEERPKRRERAAMYEFTPEYLYRRAYSEVKLLDLFGTFDFKEGHCYNFLTAGVGDRFAFGLQTSANFDTNPRTEQASLSIDRGLYEFYKDYFDKIITFEKEDR